MVKTVRFLSIIIIVGVVLTLTGGLLTAQGDTPVASLIELPPDGPDIFDTFPAPDGRHLIHIGEYEENDYEETICAYDVVDDVNTCLPLPEDSEDFPEYLEPDYENLYTPLAIATETLRLAIVGKPLDGHQDTDLWVVNFETGEIVKIADDGFEDGDNFPTYYYEHPEPDAAGAIIDLQPAWSPDGTQIAVERTLINEEGFPNPSTLTLIDAATGAAQDLTPLPAAVGEGRDQGSTIGLAWSPDGALLAASLRHDDWEQWDSEQDGIWLVDVETGETRQLASVTAVEESFQATLDLPDDGESFVAFITNLYWSPDGSRLLFWADYMGPNRISWVFWVERNTGVIHALMLPPHPDGLVQPMQVAWSPKGDKLLVTTMERSPYPHEVVVSLDPTQEEIRRGMSVRLIDAASGEMTLLGHLPILGPARAGDNAVWGPTGDVILGSYHMVIVP